MKNLFDKRYPVTNGLLAVTALVFLFIQIFRFGQTTTAYTIFEFGGMYGEVVRYDPTQLWRLVSPVFVHIGWEHFLFNGITLLGLGYQLEGLFGLRSTFFSIYYLVLWGTFLFSSLHQMWLAQVRRPRSLAYLQPWPF